MSANVAVKLSRREQKATTRGLIKQAARDCFYQRGYQATNIADIAAAAAVAHGTFYVHFTNKAEILDELLTEFNHGLAARLQPIFAAATAHAGGIGSPTPPSLAATVRATAEIFLEYWHTQRDFVACYAQHSAGGLDASTLRDGINPPMFGLLSAALAAVAARRGVVAGNFELVTQGLLAMWLRIGMQYLFNPRVSRDDAIDVLVRLSIGSIGAVLTELVADPIDAALPTPPRSGAHEEP